MNSKEEIEHLKRVVRMHDEHVADLEFKAAVAQQSLELARKARDREAEKLAAELSQVSA